MNIYIRGMRPVFQFMQDSPGGQQQQTVTGRKQKEAALAALLPWLAQVIAQGQLQAEACADAGRVDTLRGTGSLPNPKWPVIGAVAGGVRTILEGAGGGWWLNYAGVALQP